jgi:hypothetical protein
MGGGGPADPPRERKPSMLLQFIKGGLIGLLRNRNR